MNYLGVLTQGPRVVHLLIGLGGPVREYGVLPVHDKLVQFAIIHAAGRGRGEVG